MSHCSQCSKLMRGVCRFCHPQEYIDMVQQALMDLAKEPLLIRQWVGLTDDEIDLLEELYAPPVHPDFVNDADHCLELIRHVEAKLKEKNT